MPADLWAGFGGTPAYTRSPLFIRSRAAVIRADCCAGPERVRTKNDV